MNQLKILSISDIKRYLFSYNMEQIKSKRFSELLYGQGYPWFLIWGLN